MMYVSVTVDSYRNLFKILKSCINCHADVEPETLSEDGFLCVFAFCVEARDGMIF